MAVDTVTHAINVYDDEDGGDWLGLVDIEMPGLPTPEEKSVIEGAAQLLVRAMYGVAERAHKADMVERAERAVKLSRLFSLNLNEHADIDFAEELVDSISETGYTLELDTEDNMKLKRTRLTEPYIDVSVVMAEMTNLA